MRLLDLRLPAAYTLPFWKKISFVVVFNKKTMNSSPSKQFGCRINITNNAAASLLQVTIRDVLLALKSWHRGYSQLDLQHGTEVVGIATTPTAEHVSLLITKPSTRNTSAVARGWTSNKTSIVGTIVFHDETNGMHDRPRYTCHV